MAFRKHQSLNLETDTFDEDEDLVKGSKAINDFPEDIPELYDAVYKNTGTGLTLFDLFTYPRVFKIIAITSLLTLRFNMTSTLFKSAGE